MLIYPVPAAVTQARVQLVADQTEKAPSHVIAEDVINVYAAKNQAVRDALEDLKAVDTKAVDVKACLPGATFAPEVVRPRGVPVRPALARSGAARPPLAGLRAPDAAGCSTSG